MAGRRDFVILRKEIALRIWITGFVGVAVLQTLFPKQLAARSRWAYSPGWQREIAIWNIGTVAAATLVRRPNSDVDGSLLTAFLLMSALLGSNHLLAALRSPRSVTHWLGVLANGVGAYVALEGLDED